MTLTPLLPRLQHVRPTNAIPPLSAPVPPIARQRPSPTRFVQQPWCSTHSFSTSPILLARNQDHYSTLGVTASASTKEIKAHFYQLSKQYHPDLNKDDEGAKKKFQEVSEAWSVVGNERGRRDYDRHLRMGGSSSSGDGGYGPTQNYSYDPTDNTSRRARATYAWEYQRRRGRTGHARSGHSRSEAEDSRYAHARARGSFGSGMGDSTGPGGYERSLFEKYVAQQRRREEFASSRTSSTGSTSGGGSGGYVGSSGSADDPFSAKVENAGSQTSGFRFMQIVATLTVTFVMAMSMGGGRRAGGSLEAEGDSRDEDQRNENMWQGGKSLIVEIEDQRPPQQEVRRVHT